jgi:hypothetical protein
MEDGGAVNSARPRIYGGGVKYWRWPSVEVVVTSAAVTATPVGGAFAEAESIQAEATTPHTGGSVLATARSTLTADAW